MLACSQELKQHTAAVEPQVSRKEDALSAAMGSPVAVVPTLEEEQPEQCQPSAGSDATVKCSLPLAVEALPDKKAQVHVIPLDSRVLTYSGPTFHAALRHTLHQMV